jgi:hypothetical protein
MTHTNWDCLEVRPISAAHKGLFATRAIAEGEVLGCFEGKIVAFDIGPDGKLVCDNGYRFNDAMQLKRSGNRLFALAEKGSASGIDLVNHSCRPNARIERGIVMVASRRIEAGEEITFDYHTTDLVPEGIRCWCPEPKCVI